MRYFPVLFLCIFFSGGLFSQSISDKIINSRTEAHTAIPGFDIFLEIPPGYARAPHFWGWQNKQGSNIILSKKQKSLKEVLAEMEAELTTEGYSTEKKNFSINNNDAILLETGENKNHLPEKNVLLIENKGTVYIIESKNTLDETNNDILKKTLLTVFLEK